MVQIVGNRMACGSGENIPACGQRPIQALDETSEMQTVPSVGASSPVIHPWMGKGNRDKRINNKKKMQRAIGNYDYVLSCWFPKQLRKDAQMCPLL